MTMRDKASRKGITALQMMPAVTKEPAFSGILLSNLSLLMRAPGLPVLWMTRQVPSRKVQDRARCVKRPIFPYCASLSIESILNSPEKILIRQLAQKLMDDNCKKKLTVVKKFIQEKKHKQALEELEVMVYKYPKVYQIHLMLGLCYQKLNNQNEAEKAYFQAHDLNNNDPQALKQLCEIYTRRGDMEKGIKYLEQMAEITKKSDNKKYREAIVKLVDMYEKDLNIEKIDGVFKQYCEKEETIGEDFVHIGYAYFRVGVMNECFFLQKFQVMGMKGQQTRTIQPAAKEELNRLLIQIIDYLKAVSVKYQLSKKDIANSIMEMKVYFPECCSLLMMLLFDEYCVGQMAFSSYILGELYYLCQAHFDESKNYYHNIKFTSPQTFAVCMLLAKEYLGFFKEFFTLDGIFDGYYPQLAKIQNQLQGVVIRDDYRKKIDKFILKECRELAQLSKNQNIEVKLQNMRERIQSLEDSYLEQVIARIALHAFKNYDQLNDMKYKLKVRIKQLPEDEIMPHLHKYYYDYVIKMARIFKMLDEEIPIRDVLNYVVKHDPADVKYQLQLIWFLFCLEAKNVEKDDRGTLAKKAIAEIQGIIGQLEGSLQSSALRRIIILKVYAQNEEMSADIQKLLEVERSFQNLQCAAFYNYRKGIHKQALILLRQAYKLNQSHYHTNRLFFLSLYKCGQIKQAFAFLQHIQPSFTSVFWINYFLAINKTNQRRFGEAESFMIKSLQAFQAGSCDNFRFYYQKVYDIGQFSLMYMVKQNQYSIFFDQLVLPEEYLYNELSAVSNIYFEREVQFNRMRLLYKQGQLLKILGRTKSSLNYLQDAFGQSLKLQVNAESEAKILFEHVLVRKEYATLLFYNCKLKQAEEMLFSAYNILQWIINTNQSPLYLKLNDQIRALFFQISISRLSIMIKFQTQECITEYLIQFRKNIKMPEKTSLTYLKNKYQFHILQYMHQRSTTQQVEESVQLFIDSFGLNFSDRTGQGFANRIQELGQAQRKYVRECLEDYYIVRNLSNPPAENELLFMLSLFPRSCTLCILFGSVTEDVRLKTASFLKVIQLDKQSSISMDILASLYLKQKNYLAAAKLFLKSLETDILNPKCYLGLAICLFCLIVRSVEEADKRQVEIVRESLMRINSYMQFLKLNDPFENYHLLEFLKLLLSDNSQSHFKNQLILQSAFKNCMRYKDSLLGELLENVAQYWKDFNFWRRTDQIAIFDGYIQKIVEKEVIKDYSQTSKALLKRAQGVCEQFGKVAGNIGREIIFKKFEKVLHQIGLSICLSLKNEFRQNIFELILSACKSWQRSFAVWNFAASQLHDLKKQVKGYIYEYMLLKEWNQDKVYQINQIFKNVQNFDHLVHNYKKIPKLEREVARQMLLYPNNENIRRIYTGFQVVKKGYNVRRAKLSHRLELQNTNNLNTTQDSRFYKQLYLLYHDPYAILMHLSRRWDNPAIRTARNVQRWVKLINHIISKPQMAQNLALLEKGRRMKLQMLAFLQVQFDIQLQISMTEYQQQKLRKFIATFRIIQKLSRKKKVKDEIQQLKNLYKNSEDELDQWILLNLVSYIARRVKVNSSFDDILERLLSKTTDLQIVGFIKLLIFLEISHKNIQNEADLVQQIVSLTTLSGQCQQLVSPTTGVILECTRCFSAGSLQQVQLQLIRAAQCVKITSYSDQLLINFFEVLVQYKNAEGNPNGEGVIDYFMYMAESMLSTITDPLLKGFMYSLKGMIQSLAFGQSVSIKSALLYSPQAAKVLLVQPS